MVFLRYCLEFALLLFGVFALLLTALGIDACTFLFSGFLGALGLGFSSFGFPTVHCVTLAAMSAPMEGFLGSLLFAVVKGSNGWMFAMLDGLFWLGWAIWVVGMIFGGVVNGATASGADYALRCVLQHFRIRGWC